jgi:hypothetical protein
VAEVGPPGVLQLQIEGYYNRHGRDRLGRCCTLQSNSTASEPKCPSQCRTFFRVCAARVGPNWPEEPDLRQHTLACPLGLLVTPTLARNSLDPHRDGLLLMRFPYKEWPVSNVSYATTPMSQHFIAFPLIVTPCFCTLINTVINLLYKIYYCVHQSTAGKISFNTPRLLL